ncbi:hypothetical protein EGM88_14890 [Aureibaculum marinum]|uniref:Bacteriocin n=1 Tax=Aureibaculum marinum TaxID=2487930 RepID=A0A3N4N525_9FLAO|nr:hypothetical protein EGM88_14890 [Aureibaculum marinum]
MKELSLEKLENLEGGKFWGNDKTCGDTYEIAGSCYRNCTKSYRMFWIKFNKTPVTEGAAC